MFSARSVMFVSSRRSGGGVGSVPASILVEFEGSSSLAHRIDYAMASGGGVTSISLVAGDKSHTLTPLLWNTAYDIDIVAISGAVESTVLSATIYTAPPQLLLSQRRPTARHKSPW